MDLLEFLSKNDFIDKTVSTNKIKLMVSYAGIIADRNYEIVKQLFRNLQNKESQLVCSLLLRDLIENIKLYLYFIIGNKKEIYFEEGNNKFLKIEVVGAQFQSKFILNLEEISLKEFQEELLERC